MFNILILSQLFVFFSFGVGESDLSIFFLILVIFLNFSRLSLRKSELISWLCVLIIGFLYLGFGYPALLKLIASFILILSIYSIVKDGRYNINVNIVILFSFMWFAAALITVVQRDAFSFAMYRVGVSEGRGASGLTAEPSLLGIYSSFYFGIINIIHRKLIKEYSREFWIVNKQKLLLNIAACMMLMSVLVAQSLMGYLFLFAVLVYQKHFKLLLLFTFIVIILIFSGYFANASHRLAILTQYMLNMDVDRLSADGSLMHRLNSFIVFSDPSQFKIGQSLSAGLSPIVYLFGFSGQLLVIFLMFAFEPFRSTLYLSRKSVTLMGILLVLFVVGPITVIPFWLLITLERRLV